MAGTQDTESKARGSLGTPTRGTYLEVGYLRTRQVVMSRERATHPLSGSYQMGICLQHSSMGRLDLAPSWPLPHLLPAEADLDPQEWTRSEASTVEHVPPP